MPTTADRLLIHGPRLGDLTDLLYFDKIVYPVTVALIRPSALPPGLGGYALSEPLAEETRERLVEADLLIPPGLLYAQPSLDNMVSELLKGADSFAQWAESSAKDIGAKIGDIAMTSLDTNASPPEVEQFLSLIDSGQRSLEEFAANEEIARWLVDIDTNTRKIASSAEQMGSRAVAKFYASDYSRVLHPGNDAVLDVVLSQFPTIDAGRVNLDELIAFLTAEETKIKRRRLFSWQNEIQRKVESGAMRTQDIPDLIATLADDYRIWIEGSGMSSKPYRAAEFLLALGEVFVDALSLVRIPNAIKTILQWGKQELALTKEELSAPGKDIAYIVHCERNFGR